MIFKIIGGLLVVWGVLDLGLSWMGTDVWMDWLGVDLWSISELLWTYIAWAEILIGSVIWSMGGSEDEAEA
ncbi:MAG: hypothetical protein QNJ29_01190 [Rhizobiaceae bacterium]|nr:hypothetical protein [Rhizobiaceae bacterium]